MSLDASYILGQIGDVALTAAAAIESAYATGEAMVDPRLVYLAKTALLMFLALLFLLFAWRWKRTRVTSDPRHDMYLKAQKDEARQDARPSKPKDD